MTATAAQAAAASLRDALQDYGVRTSIELQPGVGPKADPWGPAPFVRNLGHHIASYPPGTPGLAVVKNGRKGASPLQGPLANCYGGFDLVARIITMGWANHPGAGGPWLVPGWGTVPKDNGRPYILGWEFEGGYLPYTDEMHDFMSRCGAASLDWLGTHNRREPAPLECHDEHNGWAGPRKPDRIGYTTASGRQRIAAVRSNPRPTPVQEDDMTPDQAAKLDRIHFELTNRFPSRVPGSKAAETAVGYILNTDAAAFQSLQLDRAQAGAITALTQLVAAQNGLTIDEVRRVVSEEIAKGVDVDVTVAPGTA